jgi:hypothetical protein
VIEEDYSPISIRRQSSTTAIETGLSRPTRARNLSTEIERTASHRIALRFLSPPSGGFTTTCDGIALIVEVTGSTMTSPAGP